MSRFSEETVSRSGLTGLGPLSAVVGFGDDDPDSAVSSRGGTSRLKLTGLGPLSAVIGLSDDDPGSAVSSKGGLKLTGLGSLFGAARFDNNELESGGSSKGVLARIGSSGFPESRVAKEAEKPTTKKGRKCMPERKQPRLE